MSKCVSCKDFFGNSILNMKCSYCFHNISKKSLNQMKAEYIKKYLIESESMIKAIEVCLKKDINQKEKFIIDLYSNMLKPSDKFFFANEIKKLVDIVKDNKLKHILVSMVGDWWNINSSKGWESTLVCYYGNFNEDIDINYPLRKPHSIFNGSSSFSNLFKQK